ncbi:MAG: pilus assembly protein TadE [Pseudonocardiales bacterium]|nr:MAG: pilus assembly protein TadE [Pseudonocardiales bacterium]
MTPFGPDRAYRHDRGSATVELATALPVLVFLLAVALSAVGAVTVQMRCVDAAREGARAAARGEPEARVAALARQEAPSGARIEVAPAGAGMVAVTVTCRVPLAGRLAPVTVHARASAAVEPGVPP